MGLYVWLRCALLGHVFENPPTGGLGRVATVEMPCLRPGCTHVKRVTLDSD